MAPNMINSILYIDVKFYKIVIQYKTDFTDQVTA